MIKHAILILLLLSSTAFAKYPYDSVGRSDAGGSAVLIDAKGSKGLVITNAHVMTTLRSMKVYWPSAKATRVCTPIYVNKDADFALLVCDMPPVQSVKVGFPVRKSVIATGFPYYERSHLHWQTGNIVLKSKNEILYNNRPVPGMSGGAAFDLDGKWVGMIKGHDHTNGVLVSTTGALGYALIKYRELETWIPNYDHVEDPRDWEYAKQDGKRRTIRYTERGGLDLID